MIKKIYRQTDRRKLRYLNYLKPKQNVSLATGEFKLRIHLISTGLGREKITLTLLGSWTSLSSLTLKVKKKEGTKGRRRLTVS